jgi:proteic killer suppression protein
VIVSFGDALTADLFHGRQTARTRRVPPEVVAVALRKLDMVNAAAKLEDLRVPPGNRLEALKGDLQGCHSIRVNDQWRIIFRWAESGVQAVRFTDYHS